MLVAGRVGQRHRGPVDSGDGLAERGGGVGVDRDVHRVGGGGPSRHGGCHGVAEVDRRVGELQDFHVGDAVGPVVPGAAGVGRRW